MYPKNFGPLMTVLVISRILTRRVEPQTQLPQKPHLRDMRKTVGLVALMRVLEMRRAVNR